jgi:hypothetical protein
LQGYSELVQIALALDVLGLLFGSGKRWQQQCRQNAYDGDDDQQLDESERPSRLPISRAPHNGETAINFLIFGSDFAVRGLTILGWV